jgi:hypothetical protein
MDDTINYLSSHNVRLLKQGETVESVRNGTNVGATVGMLWLDIEGTQVTGFYGTIPEIIALTVFLAQYWSSSPTNNINFLQAMVDEGNARGVSLGERTHCCGAESVFCSSFTPAWDNVSDRHLLEQQPVVAHHGWHLPVQPLSALVRRILLYISLLGSHTRSPPPVLQVRALRLQPVVLGLRAFRRLELSGDQAVRRRRVFLLRGGRQKLLLSTSRVPVDYCCVFVR